MRSSVLLMAGALFGLVAACGGKVFVDSTAGAGSGGSGASLNVGGAGAAPSQVTGVGGSSCFTLPSALTNCTGAVSSGAGGPSQCDFFFCDSDGNQWDANCTGSSCVCTKNGMVLCTCAINEGGDVCSGIPNCCGLVAGI